MCNCGNKRNEYVQQAFELRNEIPNEKISTDAMFQYTGQTALTVIGSISRKKYRFSHMGDIQSIDHRDASGMMAIPNLVRK